MAECALLDVVFVVVLVLVVDVEGEYVEWDCEGGCVAPAPLRPVMADVSDDCGCWRCCDAYEWLRVEAGAVENVDAFDGETPVLVAPVAAIEPLVVERP